MIATNLYSQLFTQTLCYYETKTTTTAKATMPIYFTGKCGLQSAELKMVYRSLLKPKN